MKKSFPHILLSGLMGTNKEGKMVSFSSIARRSLLLGGMAVGMCSMSLGVAATSPQQGLKKITTTFSGSVSPSGAIEDNKTGTIIGEIDRAGVVYNNKGVVVGAVDAKGVVHDAKGVPVAEVSRNNRLAGVAFLLEK